MKNSIYELLAAPAMELFLLNTTFENKSSMIKIVKCKVK